jgi:DNA polymerase-3 subunit delta'
VQKWAGSHANYSLWPEGSGTLAMAIAYMPTCGNQNGELGSNEACNLKFKTSHPDLHFAYPTVTTDAVKKAKSIDFIVDWRKFVTQNPYGGLFDWYAILGVQNKQGRN